MFGGRVLGVVEYKFGEWQIVYPVILLIRTVGTNVSFEGLICALCKSVGTRVVSSGVTKGDPELSSECFPKVGDENRSTVRDDRVWKPVMTKKAIEKEPGKIGG